MGRGSTAPTSAPGTPPGVRGANGTSLNMPGTCEIQYAVEPDERRIGVRVVGTGSMNACPAMKNTLQELVAGVGGDLFVDLSQATFIDSTFAGLLLMFARQSTKRGCAVHLVGVPGKILDTIRGMHIQGFFRFGNEMPLNRTTWSPLVQDQPRPAAAADVIVESHQELIDADGRNEAEFGRVVEGFKRRRPQANGGES